MYFQYFDTFHTTIAIAFLAVAFGVVFSRYRKYASQDRKSVNYVIRNRALAVRFISLLLSILLLGVALLGPVGLLQSTNSRTAGMDCIWVLDVSASMDVEDVEENTGVSRLSKAKSIMENFMVTHPENRYGLVIFAGQSRLVSPLTSDSSSLLSFLASIDSKSIAEGGTDFREAFKVATERFESTDNAPHAIVLLSDGGDPEDMSDPDMLRSIFREKPADIVTIGIGQTRPSPIPVGKTPFWDITYKRFQGQEVLSGLNRKNLKTIAESGNGSYLEGDSLVSDLQKTLASVSRHTVWETRNGTTDDATTRLFIATSLLFLLTFFLFPSSSLKVWSA